MRAIDADAAGRELKTAALKRENFPQTGIVLVDEIVRYLDTCPTLDVAPVKHGEWILRHVGAGHYWECSVCNKNPCIYVTKDTKFCPNCGAQMDAGQEGDGHG